MVKSYTLSKQQLNRHDVGLLKAQGSKEQNRKIYWSHRPKNLVATYHSAKVKRKPGPKGKKKLLKQDKILIYHKLKNNPFLRCQDLKHELSSQSLPNMMVNLIKVGFTRRGKIITR